METRREEGNRHVRVKCPKCREMFVTLLIDGAKRCPFCISKVNPRSLAKPPKQGLPLDRAVEDVMEKVEKELGFMVRYELIMEAFQNINRSVQWLSSWTGYNLPITKKVKKLCKDHVALHGKPAPDADA